MSYSTRSMLSIVLAAFVLFATGIANAQEVDTAALRTVQPLMEDWRFVQDDELTDEAALAATTEDWQTVNLPHTWNAEDAASLDSEGYVRGLGWYRLEFETPAAGARHWLEIGAASLVADVWLNGEHLGQHKGAFTAFRFDITDQLAAEGPNVLLIKANNTAPEEDDDLTAIAPKGGDFNIPGGLYRHVALISTPDASHFALDDLGGPGVYASTASIEGDAATLDLRALLSNDADADGEFTVRFSLVDDAGQVAATTEQPIQLTASENVEVALQMQVPSAHLWQGVADPYLYQLMAELLSADGTPVDRVVQSFGIRQMSFDPNEGFFVNGQHVRWNGVAIHQDILGKSWAMTPEDVDKSLALVTEIGANAIRLGHYPFGEYVLQRISELGLVAWSEAALGIRTTLESCTTVDAPEEYVDNALTQLSEMIRQQYNHAAVALWSIGNETTQHQHCDEPYDNVTPVLRAMHERAKAEDPSRPTAYAEFPEPVTPEERVGPFATEGITDIFATNRYFLWYDPEFEEMSQLLDDLHTLTPDQPLIVTEYGGGGAITHHTDNPEGGLPEVWSADEGEVSYQPEEYAAWLHEQNWRVIQSKPYLVGSFVWNLIDFGSANRNEGDVLGVNTKGLVTFDRETRKAPFFFYKANWSDTPVTYIGSRRYTNRAYAVTDVKVYHNGQFVELSVNGTPVGTMTVEQCEQSTCVFQDVTLADGANTVTAVGTHGGEMVEDTVEWTYEDDGSIGIAAGRLATGYESSDGILFGSDDFFVGGEPNELEIRSGNPPDIANTEDPLLYKYFRSGEFRYEIPLASGSYDVTLGFFEAGEDADEGDRIFNVTANGQPALENYDVIAAAGGAGTAVTATFTAEVTDGILTLEFTPVAGEAVVSNIWIAPAAGIAR